MTTTTNPTDANEPMTTAQVAGLVLGHLAEHGLPEPCSLLIEAGASGRPAARVQISGGRGLVEVAGVLLAWAHSLPSATVRVWLPPTGGSVHLDVDTIVSGPDGSVPVTVYGGVVYEPAVFGPLERDERRPVPLGQLTTWATSGAGVAA